MSSPNSLDSASASPTGSGYRIAVGILLFVGSIVLAMLGFAEFIHVWDGGGTATPDRRTALLFLASGGAGRAGGIATLIWDVAKRFER